MSYGHASAILLASGQKNPATELRVAVKRLGAWATLNPGLMSLYLDFEACLSDLDTYLAVTDPPTVQQHQISGDAPEAERAARENVRA